MVEKEASWVMTMVVTATQRHFKFVCDIAMTGDEDVILFTAKIYEPHTI
jgi:hypothetical protein